MWQVGKTAARIFAWHQGRKGKAFMSVETRLDNLERRMGKEHDKAFASLQEVKMLIQRLESLLKDRLPSV